MHSVGRLVGVVHYVRHRWTGLQRQQSNRRASARIASHHPHLVGLVLFVGLIDAALSLASEPGDATRSSSPQHSRGTAESVCFSKSLPPDGDLPRFDDTDSSHFTAAIRAKLSEPLRCAWFFGLKTLEPEDAMLLAKVPGYVSVSLENGLNAKSAEHLGRHRGILAIESVRDLTDETARALGRHRGDLHLYDVARLTNEAMAFLAQCDGKLTLGLDTLAVDQARILSRVRGGLQLPNVRAIDEETAEVLGQYPGGLEIGLTQLSAKVAKHLAQRRGSLGFYTQRRDLRLRLNADAARELSSYRGDLLIRPTCEGPADEVFGALSAHGGQLYLLLEQRLSATMARALSTHVGPLRLGSLPAIEHDAAAMLALHKSSLNLSSCDLASSDAIRALSEHRGTELRLRLGDELSEASARALAQYQGTLSIEEKYPNCCPASIEAVSALAAHRGRLYVPSSMVRDDTVDVVRSHIGGLGVRTSRSAALSVEVARRLATIDGWLRVDGQVSTECLRELAAHNGDLVLDPLPQHMEDTEVLLGRKNGKLYCGNDSAVKTIAAARLVASDAVATDINHTSSLLGRDAVAIASALATRNGRLSMPHLEYVTADALRTLIQKSDIELKPIDALYVFNSDGCVVPAATVVPDLYREFNERHQPPRTLDAPDQSHDH